MNNIELYLYLRLDRRRKCKCDVRVNTSQREQYSVTVHLFIGTRRSPDKITFMSMTFTLNHNASYQVLSSLFPLRSVSFLIFVIILSRSSISHSFDIHPYHLRVVSSYRACLYHERKPSSQNRSLL